MPTCRSSSYRLPTCWHLSQCTPHSRTPGVYCSLGEGIGVTSLCWGVVGSDRLPPLQALCNLALFRSRLRCSFLSFFDFLLARFGKSGIVFKTSELAFGLDCPGGGVPNDWFLGPALGGDKNPVILPCTIVVTQWALWGLVLTRAEWPNGLEYLLAIQVALSKLKIQETLGHKSRYFTQFILKNHNSNDSRILGSWLSNGATLAAVGALKNV